MLRPRPSRASFGHRPSQKTLLEGFGALPLIVMALGLAVAAWIGWKERRGDGVFDARPEGPFADTRVPLVLACVVWAAGQVALGLCFANFAMSAPMRVLAVTALHVFVALVVLRSALSGPRSVLSAGGAWASGLVGGVATYGVVALVSIGLIQAYAAAGVEVPNQNVVEILRAADPLGKVIMIGSAVALAPFAEEVFYRGVMLPVFAGWMPARTANLAQALLFGFSHFWQSPTAWPLSLAIAVVGWAAGWIYLRTGSLKAAVLLHATFNGLQVALLFAAPQP